MTEEQAAQPKTVYQAVLCIHGVVLPPAGLLEREPFKLPIGDGALKLSAPFQARKYWADNGFPEGEQSLMLYPRTDDEGYLAPGTLLRRVREIDACKLEPGLHAVGQLTNVRPDLGTITLTIFPNVKAQLRAPFRLPLQISLEGIGMLPEVYQGLELWADFKPKSGRLVVTKLSKVPLPEKGTWEKKPKPERKAREEAKAA